MTFSASEHRRISRLSNAAGAILHNLPGDYTEEATAAELWSRLINEFHDVAEPTAVLMAAFEMLSPEEKPALIEMAMAALKEEAVN